MQESLRLSRMTRFYIKQKEDPHGPHIAIYVSCLPTSLSQRQYEHILLDMIGRGQTLTSLWISHVHWFLFWPGVIDHLENRVLKQNLTVVAVVVLFLLLLFSVWFLVVE